MFHKSIAKMDEQDRDYGFIYAGVGLIVLGFNLLLFQGIIEGFVVIMGGAYLIIAHKIG